VSHAWSRTTWGSSSAAIPSRFLSELPEQLVEDAAGSSSVLDPRRDIPLWGRRGRRRAPGSVGDGGDGDDRVEIGFEADDADDWHDPDPWRHEERHEEAAFPAAVPAARQRRAPVRRAPGTGRLPKMAEEKFGRIER
ncbi:MAG TPA: hypothetical protein VK428_10775, partial [Acidimicrobiales bacterium]|nr:hypothetical protein [Acidimicrobiales bacterium]